MNPIIRARDALYQAQMTVNALEAVEVLTLSGDGNGDLQLLKVDNLGGLLYLIRTRLEEQLDVVDSLLSGPADP